MRARIILTVVVSASLALGELALGEQDAPIRTISVSGTVETKTAPDLIVWRIGLMNSDRDLRAAKEESDEEAKSVVALREKLGIAEGDLETGRVSIDREYERDQRGNRKGFKHFVVRRNITIRQRDLKQFDVFLDALVSSAEMEVSFFSESSRIHELRAETRLKALQAAKEKAAAMAEAVGAKLGRVITINEHPQTGRRLDQFTNNYISVGPGRPTVDVASDTFVPGAITVRVTVYAAFELQ